MIKSFITPTTFAILMTKINKRAQRALGRSPEERSKVTVEPFPEDH